VFLNNSEEIAEDWGKLRNEELTNYHTALKTPNITSRKIRHEYSRNVYKIFSGMSRGKRTLIRPKSKGDQNRKK
jgi:hypothetical protein